jgi:hypothetical protein
MQKQQTTTTNMKLTVKKRELPSCPKGARRGRCVHAGPAKERVNLPCDEQIQLTFEVVIGDQRYSVYRKFCADLTEGSGLHQFLENWLKDEFKRYIDEDGVVDFDRLYEKEADIVVYHFGKEEKPFVGILSIAPAGSLVED